MLIIHVAINGKGERFEHAVEVYGRLIPFEGLDQNDFKIYRRNISNLKYWKMYGTFPSVRYWKQHTKRGGAIRFQRVAVTRHD